MQMPDNNSQKKNKICLTDYNFHQDIDNRLLMAQFTSIDLEVLEEILYSSITIPVRKLGKNLDLDENQLQPILEKLSKTGLFTFTKELITVDKEMRKYFEMQLLKFDPDFRPGIDFLQSLLRKIPIHVLPVWYSISRVSSNIFDSIIEKYLLTPQIFQRYLMELSFSNPVLDIIVKDLYNAPDFTLFAKEIMEKHHLSRELFEEHLLYLEFHFLCCLGYRKVKDEWEEIVTPFQEWQEYLSFLRTTEAPPIFGSARMQRFRPHDFSFIQDLSSVLTLAKKQPISLSIGQGEEIILNPTSQSEVAIQLQGFNVDAPTFKPYVSRLINKLRLLKLADIVDNRLYALETSSDYLDTRAENQAMFLYRHPLNRPELTQIPSSLCTDRNLKEAEKTIQRVLYSGWVYFDDFIKGVIISLSEQSLIILKKQGKTWKYQLPTYSDDEVALIKTIIFDWLFEVGVTAIGTCEGKDCFSVTPFGQSLFGR